MLTAYDFSMAKIIDEAGVDIILVGDSLGNVIMGERSTQGVTMADMVHHTKSVSRGVKWALVVADMPKGAMVDPVRNARALVEAGAEAVKVEGIKDIKGIKEIMATGIPVMGHLGLLPQSINNPKDYKVQRDPQIINQAKGLEKAGVFSIVLELVPAELARKTSEAVFVPTIGIGSGPDCDGQVLVSYDMFGLFPAAPKHAKRYLNLTKEITQAVKQFLLDTAGSKK